MMLNALLGYDSSDSIKAVVKKAHSMQNNEGAGKYYRTSASTLALLGDSTSYQARKFLRRSGSLYTSVPGVLKHSDARDLVHPKETPKSLLAKLQAASETAAEEKLKTQREQPDPLDFNRLFDNQPDANYFPRGLPASHVSTKRFSRHSLELKSAKKASASHSAALRASPFGTASRDSLVGRCVANEASVDSDPHEHEHGHAGAPLSLKAKTALMNLMVDKSARLYSFDMQTDKTLLKIALIRGEEEKKSKRR